MPFPPATERLIFRDWQPGDLELFHSLCSDPNVMRFVGDGSPWSWVKTQQFIDRVCEMTKSLGFCQWPLIDRATAVLIGSCGFVPADDGAEIGWRLAKTFWGQDWATEAVRTVLKHGFDTLRFPRIVAAVQASNRASIRVVEKIGMRLESSFQRNGRDVLLFSIDGR